MGEDEANKTTEDSATQVIQAENSRVAGEQYNEYNFFGGKSKKTILPRRWTWQADKHYIASQYVKQDHIHNGADVLLNKRFLIVSSPRRQIADSVIEGILHKAGLLQNRCEARYGIDEQGDTRDRELADISNLVLALKGFPRGEITICYSIELRDCDQGPFVRSVLSSVSSALQNSLHRELSSHEAYLILVIDPTYADEFSKVCPDTFLDPDYLSILVEYCGDHATLSEPEKERLHSNVKAGAWGKRPLDISRYVVDRRLLHSSAFASEIRVLATISWNDGHEDTDWENYLRALLDIRTDSFFLRARALCKPNKRPIWRGKGFASMYYFYLPS